jgi:subtilisin family serine protease
MKRIAHFSLITVMLLTLVAFAGSSHSVASGTVRLLVEFQPGSKGAVKRALLRAGGNIHFEFDPMNTIAVTLPTTALKGISNNPNLVSIEEDAPRYLMGDSGGQFIPWGVERVQAPAVWDEGYEGDGITVCIIDSGLHVGHEDMVGVDVVGGYTNIEGTTWDQDYCGHGTHVAGTIAGANNDIGVVGVAPGVSLFIVKVFGDDCGWAYTSNLVNAVNHCPAETDIISMSLGGNGKSGLEARTFQALYDQGVLSVAAACNDGDTDYCYPASHDAVISVAATDINNQIADFSQQNDQVELSAPGVDVESTVPWLAVAELTVDGVTYEGHQIEFAAQGSASGALVDGGLCDGMGDWGGNVVLCARGEISFYDKVMNVQDSGGVAAVIYNNEPGSFYGTLGDGNSSVIPAISLSQEDGQWLVANKLGATGDVFSQIFIPDSSYEAWGGTSMATPHVSAVAALLWSKNPDRLTNADIRQAMALSALDLGDPGRDNAFGYGLVQAYDALEYLKPGKEGPKK